MPTCSCHETCPLVGGWGHWQLKELHEGPFGHMRVVATAMCCHTGLGVVQHTLGTVLGEVVHYLCRPGRFFTSCLSQSLCVQLDLALLQLLGGEKTRVVDSKHKVSFKFG